ncbi:class I adenylate-forming enzyme family protein [Brachybacterium squillarum]|uniref:class I adenylate-forming enzyme family protein n=1 Tax=Brachybacterium squillarum TaxID=661979 RepID=UPI0002629644|nr:class I adenylate-forming enzyme family protein [Brachybacterium squillarum]
MSHPAPDSTMRIPEIVVAELVQASATRFPDSIAIIDRGTTTTYEELDQRIDMVAATLRPLVGGNRWTRVGVTWSPSLDGVIAYYAVLRAGAVMVGLMPPKPGAELTRAIEETRPDLLILDHQTRERLGPFAQTIRTLGLTTVIDEVGIPITEKAPEGSPAPDPSDPAVLAFTSGTTGPSKCVRLSHRNIVSNAFMVGAGHRFDSTSVIYPNMPILNPLHLNAAIAAGAAFVIDPVRDAHAIAERLERCGVTHFYGIPSLFGRLAEAEGLAPEMFASVKYFSCGSKALSPSLSDRLERIFSVKMFQGYGQTESAYHSHVDDPDRPVHGSVGRSLPNTETRIVDANSREPVPFGTVGEVEIRGPQMMTGYTNRPDLEPFAKGGWFMTGDVGRLSDDGHLFVIDRLVDIGYRNGEVISPSEIERRLETYASVKEAGVALEKDSCQDSTDLVVFLVRHDAGSAVTGDDPLLDELEGLRENGEIYFVDRLPRLPINGKVDRKAILAAAPLLRTANYERAGSIDLDALTEK